MNQRFYRIALIGIAIGWCRPLAAQGLAGRATATVTIRVSVAPRFRLEAHGTTVKILGANRGGALPFTVAEVPRGTSHTSPETRLFLIVPE